MQGIDGTLQLQGDLKAEHRADDALNREWINCNFTCGTKQWMLVLQKFGSSGISTTLVFCVGFERPIGRSVPDLR